MLPNVAAEMPLEGSIVLRRRGGDAARLSWVTGTPLGRLVVPEHANYMEASAEVEMPVVGGSGQFRMAGGDGHSLTRSYSGTTGDAT
ncbi:hypothetical protein OPV22_031291 [Ensete ventricosum]|uniref:Uncharacterized protein n=1 Tax=Ensete ventricosum TaxID=4639 RepID=A0AAV8P0D8_ENSVE|nr:hypothetical protein OPV22_031291 [Ensete ventricosum]